VEPLDTVAGALGDLVPACTEAVELDSEYSMDSGAGIGSEAGCRTSEERAFGGSLED
jgi:hypothetical protein